VFTGLAPALAQARRRLEGFVRHPERHALYAAKVLLKYKLLEWQRIRAAELRAWATATPYFGILHARYFTGQGLADWIVQLVAELERSGAASREGDWVLNA